MRWFMSHPGIVRRHSARSGHCRGLRRNSIWKSGVTDGFSQLVGSVRSTIGDPFSRDAAVSGAPSRY